MQLFCFSFAGGTAAFFKQLEHATNSNMDYIMLEYSGHGARMKEHLCEDFRELAEDLYPIIKRAYDGGEYGLLGYSMGSLSAIELYRYIVEKGEMPAPKRIFIAAHTPSAMIDFGCVNENEKDEFIKQRTIAFGAVPEKLVNNKSFWRLYLPIYKADYLMISRYSLDAYNFCSELPLTAFYSETDTPIQRMKEWDKFFVHDTEYIKYDGSHFFINEHYEEMAGVISERLWLDDEI